MSSSFLAHCLLLVVTPGVIPQQRTEHVQQVQSEDFSFTLQWKASSLLKPASSVYLTVYEETSKLSRYNKYLQFEVSFT